MLERDCLTFLIGRDQGRLTFDPRLQPEHFQCAFTAAEGWGAFRQTWEGTAARYELELRWGRPRLRSLAFTLPEGARPKSVNAKIGQQTIPATLHVNGRRVEVGLAQDIVVSAGTRLEVAV